MSSPLFHLELHSATRTLSRVCVRPEDLDPILEHAHFRGMRSGRLPEVMTVPPWSIEPVWSDGGPTVEAFEISLSSPAGGTERCRVGTGFLDPLRESVQDDLQNSGRIEEGEDIRSRVLCFLDETSLDAGTPEVVEELELHLQAVDAPIPVRQADLRTLSQGATEYGGRAASEGFPVVIPRSVVREAEDLKARAGGVETGGLLLGHLCRDPERRDLFLQVTSLIPAEHTVADEHRLTFTPATWAAADAAIRLRDESELLVGWFHTHPARYWCKDCPAKSREQCPLARDFFSSADRTVHRAIFPKAYGIALVVGDRASGDEWETSHAVFGWDEGCVRKRSFHILEDERSSSEISPTRQGATEHDLQ